MFLCLGKQRDQAQIALAQQRQQQNDVCITFKPGRMKLQTHSSYIRENEKKKDTNSQS